MWRNVQKETREKRNRLHEGPHPTGFHRRQRKMAAVHHRLRGRRRNKIAEHHAGPRAEPKPICYKSLTVAVLQVILDIMKADYATLTVPMTHSVEK